MIGSFSIKSADNDNIRTYSFSESGNISVTGTESNPNVNFWKGKAILVENNHSINKEYPYIIICEEESTVIEYLKINNGKLFGLSYNPSYSKNFEGKMGVDNHESINVEFIDAPAFAPERQHFNNDINTKHIPDGSQETFVFKYNSDSSKKIKINCIADNIGEIYLNDKMIGISRGGWGSSGTIFPPYTDENASIFNINNSKDVYKDNEKVSTYLFDFVSEEDPWDVISLVSIDTKDPNFYLDTYTIRWENVSGYGQHQGYFIYPNNDINASNITDPRNGGPIWWWHGNPGHWAHEYPSNEDFVIPDANYKKSNEVIIRFTSKTSYTVYSNPTGEWKEYEISSGFEYEKSDIINIGYKMYQSLT